MYESPVTNPRATAVKDAQPAIVLVHGAFHGGWCWRDVALELRSCGFPVFTPTQTGLGERSHLLAAAINMDVFVDDILQVIEREDLTDLILVGHSYGGRSISGVADRIPDRIRRLVYLDGGLPVDGVSRLDAMTPDARAARVASAEAHDGGVSVPPPPASRFDVTDPVVAAWLDRHLTPQPIAVEASALRLILPLGANRPVTYVHCTQPPFPGTTASASRARANRDWRFVEFPAGHNAMVTHPKAIAGLIASEALR